MCDDTSIYPIIKTFISDVILCSSININTSCNYKLYVILLYLNIKIIYNYILCIIIIIKITIGWVLLIIINSVSTYIFVTLIFNIMLNIYITTFLLYYIGDITPIIYNLG